MATHHHTGRSFKHTSHPRRGSRLGLLLGAATLGAVGVAVIVPHASATTPNIITADAGAQNAAASILSTGQAASRGTVRGPIAEEDTTQRLPDAQAAVALAQARVRALNDPRNHPRGASAAAPPSLTRTSATAANTRTARAGPSIATPTHASASDAATAPTPPAGPAGPHAYRAYAQSKVSATQFSCLDALWTKESGWQATARNPYSTAYGIPQLLDSTWAATGIKITSNGYRQVDAGLVYIVAAYGTPCSAFAHSNATNWY
jgi:hypothetical protein